MDPLGRGWSPTARQQRGFLLAVGLLLVINPFYLDALGIGTPTYVYESAPVTATGGDLSTPFERKLYDSVAGVDCYREVSPGRACALDAVLVGNRTIRTHYPGTSLRGDRYTFVRDQFYERITTGADERTLDVRPVAATAVLANVVTAERALSRPERRAVRRGSARTHEPLRRGNHFVEIDGAYYLIYEATVLDGPFAESTFQDTVSLVGVGVGLLSFARGVRLA